jgi:EAL and modified HD-GYP domain-containing signal transduction protein
MENSKSNRRFIGRQAILDDSMEVYGYELLFRAGSNNAFSGEAEHATNQIIDSCISMTTIPSCKNLFINCTRDVLVNMRVRLLPRRTVVLEVLETVDHDKELVRACKELKKSGFRLALDHFTPEESKREVAAIADFIKLDFRASTPAMRQEIYKMCSHKKGVFLAEKVETLSEVEIARAEGNRLYQGYFHSRPEIISEAQIPANKAAYLQLFVMLTKPNVHFREVERLVLLEPSLCFRLLRIANSALYGIPHRISTIQHALMMVGEDSLRTMIAVSLAGTLCNTSNDADVTQSLERASFCRSLGAMLEEDPAELYMLGMLSMMDHMLNIPMTRLVNVLSVNARVEEALLGSPEGLGRALELCRFHERGGPNESQLDADPLVREVASLYFEALLSAVQTLHALKASK